MNGRVREESPVRRRQRECLGRGLAVGKIKRAAGRLGIIGITSDNPHRPAAEGKSATNITDYGQSVETSLMDLTLKWDIWAASLAPCLPCFWPAITPVTSTLWPT